MPARLVADIALLLYIGDIRTSQGAYASTAGYGDSSSFPSCFNLSVDQNQD
jgi:hypothetical protein